MSKTYLALVVVVIIAIGGYVFPKVNMPSILGANPGPVFSNFLEFEGGVVNRNTLSTTTPASMTLRTADIAGYDTVIVRPTGAASAKTLTFFASSTAGTWLPRAGDTQRTCFVNATTTAGATIIFAAGTGIDLQTSSSTISDLTLSADNTACFTFTRKAQSTSIANSFDIYASMTEFNDGD